MRRFMVCCWLVACAAPPATPSPTARAATLPLDQLEGMDGQASSLQSALGDSVGVIDLWATWCVACERERPKLARLDAAYRSQGLRVIGLNVGEARSVVSSYLVENRISYPVYLDPDFRMADALGDNQLPTILVIDRHGHIAHRGSSLDQPTLALVKSLLLSAE